ncbi:hypothetical protein LAZ67_2003469 [Cordylochernes scorpioides]|uniref:Uncharacterized protein n=1 Tax=Cordylochernes scorpioides TaxID=51811 RepID=A0ABY6K2W7_9ARAC|nr:hypothetical protein LAZ67_2003469 [Cordylochernes scorpioides]
MPSQGPKEELLGLLMLSGQTRGEDIANAYDWKNKGATTILQSKINHEILTFNCIIHLKNALCLNYKVRSLISRTG